MSYYRPPDDVPGPDLGREAPPVSPAPSLELDAAELAAKRKKLILGICLVVDVIIAIVLLAIFVF